MFTSSEPSLFAPGLEAELNQESVGVSRKPGPLQGRLWEELGGRNMKVSETQQDTEAGHPKL